RRPELLILGSQGAVQLMRKLLRDPSFILGAILVLIVLACALFSKQISPHDPGKLSLTARLAEPFSSEYLLGGDPVGRDMLSRIIYGSRISLMVGFLSVSIAMVAGTLLGLLAGYLGGWVDSVLMRLVDVQLA